MVIFKGERPGNGPVIYCANHFSTLDIPSMTLLPKQACFVGKQSITKLPLFGYMFKTLHITVNRNSFKDRGRVYQKYKEAINTGKSLFIFPEGGISSTNIPKQSNYKEGAFKAAIELNVPIIPVTIPTNWKVLPDGDWLLKGNRIKLIVHNPIDTTHMALEDVSTLKEEVRNLIQDTIDEQNDLEQNK
jgi:1-acyl-sn-glycerol-3-phosphate acyltransferase